MKYEITTSKGNKDLPQGMNLAVAKQYYLGLYGSFVSMLPFPEFYECPDKDDVYILDFAQGPCGLKAYGAEKLIATCPDKTLGYASPRVGHAPEAIAMLAEMYNKKAVFFAAASSEITPHQAVVLGYKTSDLRFVRIPAMPCLNSWIRAWAEKFDAIALPFGLANTPMVTAGLVNLCEQHSLVYGEPTEFYCAVSTGTMIRALQIGWPRAKAVGVAVARNMKDGEIGNAEVTSYHKTFYQEADNPPPFDTTMSYDAKAYRTFIEQSKPGAVFINVGSDEQITKRLSRVKNWQKINAEREWGDQNAFIRP